MSGEDKQKIKEYTKQYLEEYRKNQSNNMLKKIIQSDKLKGVGMCVVNEFIKDEEKKSIDDNDFDVDIADDDESFDDRMQQ